MNENVRETGKEYATTDLRQVARDLDEGERRGEKYKGREEEKKNAERGREKAGKR